MIHRVTLDMYHHLIVWFVEALMDGNGNWFNIIQLSADPVGFYFHTSNCRSRSRNQIVPKFWHFWQSHWILWMSILLAPCPFYIPPKASSMYCNLLHTSYMSDLHLVRIFRVFMWNITTLFCILDIYHCGKAFLTDVTSEDSCALGGFVFGDTFW